MGVTLKKLVLGAAIIVALVNIIVLKDVFLQYLRIELNPFFLFVYAYFFMVVYSVFFLATGISFGRDVVSYICYPFQVFLFISIIMLGYFQITTKDQYFTDAMLVVILSLTGPEGLLATALVLAINEEEGVHEAHSLTGTVQIPAEWFKHGQSKNVNVGWYAPVQSRSVPSLAKSPMMV
mmetsp:Transcript_36652/g.42180  ORF Transcript_36652/g.42180 Transcript_36652/m.42180 type:complete len:179 (-) Transcript_36652:42-578(-)